MKPLGVHLQYRKAFPCSHVECRPCVGGDSWAESGGVSEGCPFKVLCFPKIQHFCQVPKFLGQHPEATREFYLGVPEKALWVPSGSEEPEI